jgi:hypothetical protein
MSPNMANDPLERLDRSKRWLRIFYACDYSMSLLSQNDQ